MIGQSGSGKSSLLNILSGYTTKNVYGEVRLNGCDDVGEIRGLSNYIMQNYSLHDFITVEEAMTFAANLKLCNASSKQRCRKVSANINQKPISKAHARLFFRSQMSLICWGSEIN